MVGQTLGSTETFTSGGMSSSTKKTGVHTKIKSSGKNQQIHEVHDGADIMTGEDCEEGGIADERYASPDMYITEDVALRKSAEGRAHLN